LPKPYAKLCLSLYAPLIVMALTGAADAQLSFQDRSAALPVKQSYEGEWNHYVGGGLAVLDCNDDGLPDFYAAGGAATSQLFVNTSAKGGEISFAQSPIEALTHVTGAYPMDVDGDGILDLVVLQDGPNTLLRGEGQCKFAPAPADWGFEAGKEWTTSFTATFEAGQDWPTLAFGNYVDETNPKGPFEACDKNYLLRPEGRRFAARTALEPGFCALSMLFSDWKRDGSPDLRISNDRQYYVRNGREQMWHMTPLAEYTEAEGWPTMKLWGMGIASRDINGDGLPEVVLTSMGDQTLQFNEGKGVMKNAPYAIGTYSSVPYLGDDGRASTGWHAEFGDINNDGRDDLFIAKGNVEQMPSNAMHDPNNLLIQKPDGSFVEEGGATGVGTMQRSRGAAVVDLNKDGLLDLLVVNRRAPLEIWQNTTKDAGHWLAVDLRTEGANSRAVGAFVEVKLPGGTVQTQEHTVGGGHASGDASPLHFGLGDAGKVELRVVWPDGAGSAWVETATDRILRVSRGEADAVILSEEN
jgi:enediyne biosynthesis protein E4